MPNDDNKKNEIFLPNVYHNLFSGDIKPEEKMLLARLVKHIALYHELPSSVFDSEGNYIDFGYVYSRSDF